MKSLTLVLLLAAAATAQQPVAAKAPASHKKIWIAAAAGAVAGALVGTQGLSFAGVPPSQRIAHQWRAGVTYGALGAAIAAGTAAAFTPSDAPAPHSFWWDRANTPLFVGIATVQVLDYTSTRYFRERGKDEWLLTNSLVDHRGAFVATEIAATAAGISLSYLFHHAGHHHGERWAAATWIAVGVVSAVANYRYPTAGHALF